MGRLVCFSFDNYELSKMSANIACFQNKLKACLHNYYKSNNFIKLLTSSSIQGSTGPQGAPGPAGNEGPKGFRGRDGNPGTDGEPGRAVRCL